MLRIPREIIVYAYKKKNQTFLMVVSMSHGWGLVKMDSKHIFLKENSFLNVVKDKKVVSSYKVLLENFLMGFYRYYFQYVQLKGMAYKSIVLFSNLIFKLGYSHRIMYVSCKDLKLLYVSKQSLMVLGRSINRVKNIVYNLQCLRKINVYKKKRNFFERFYC